MDWLIIVVIAYFILAIVNLVDKFLLDNILPSSKTYTFLVGALSGLALLLAPVWLAWPGAALLIANLAAGALFPLALLLLYRALKLGDASKILVIAGGAVPVGTLILSSIFLAEKFSARQLTAVGLLVLGTMVIAWVPPQKRVINQIMAWLKIKTVYTGESLAMALTAALIFSLFFVASKYLYSRQPFMSAFIWLRLGSFLAVLLFLLNRRWRREIFQHLKKLTGRREVKVFLANQGFAGAGFILQNYAVALGSVTLINALQGVQYALLLVLGGVITVFYPRILKENISRLVIIQKITAIILISLGLFLISFK